MKCPECEANWDEGEYREYSYSDGYDSAVCSVCDDRIRTCLKACARIKEYLDLQEECTVVGRMEVVWSIRDMLEDVHENNDAGSVSEEES